MRHNIRAYETYQKPIHFIGLVLIIQLGFTVSAHAGAWLRPKYEAEVFLKLNQFKDDTKDVKFHKDQHQLEVYTEFGLHKKLTLAMTRSGFMRTHNRPSQNGPKTEFELITYPPYVSGGLFPPYSANLLEQLTDLPVTRERKMSIAIGGTRLRDYGTIANHETYFKTSFAMGDAISFGNNKILGHSTIAVLHKGKKQIYDARAMLQFSRYRYAIGYEYGYYESTNKFPSQENVYFIETPIYKLPARIRLSVARKKNEYFSNQNVFSLWLRYPFRTKPALTHYKFEPLP